MKWEKETKKANGAKSPINPMASAAPAKFEKEPRLRKRSASREKADLGPFSINGGHIAEISLDRQALTV